MTDIDILVIGMIVLCVALAWLRSRPKMQKIRLPSGATFIWPDGWTGRAHIRDGPMPQTNQVNIGSPAFIEQIERIERTEKMHAYQIEEMRKNLKNIKPPE